VVVGTSPPATARPADTYRPTTAVELADALAHGALRRARLAVTGGGALSGRGAEPGPVDVVVDTTGLTERLRHWPADLTCVVSAGVRLRDLEEVLARHGQRLALDPPDPDGRLTVGAAVAAGAAGPARQRTGAVRDLLLGARFVLVDGTIAHSGGRVIKNVAGYDLTRLLAGSLGTLAILTEVALRLHPRPAETLSLVATATPEAALRGLEELEAHGVEVAAAELLDTELSLRLEGPIEGGALPAEGAAARRLLSEAGLSASPLPSELDASFWTARSQAHRPAPGGVAVHVATRRSQIGLVEEACRRAGEVSGLEIHRASHLGVGVHDLIVAAGDLEAVLPALAALVRQLGPLARAAELIGAPESLRREVAVPPPSACAPMAAVKRALDPENRLSPGRFRPWW